jgi:RHS repeat-associated protein
LDHQAQIISYEEYTPYGSTSYQAVRSQTETPKRYRYSGKERDEESGLNYHNARYCAPWLARWLSADPIGVGDGLNLYVYCKNNPLVHTDNSGTDARLTVDQRNHVITYSTTVHFYGNAADIALFRGAAQRATDFFRNQSGSVNIDGQSWRVEFDVQFQTHDTATSSFPTGFDTIMNQLQDPDIQLQRQQAPGLISLYSESHQRSFQTATSQVPGFRRGDSVITIRDIPRTDPADPDSAPLGRTFVLHPGLQASLGPLPPPTTRALVALDRAQNTTEDEMYRTLIHEVGHTLGFDERYRSETGGAVSHEGFEDDFMGADPDIGVGMNSGHREAAARFGAFVSNGRDIRGAAVRGFELDDTAGGREPQFFTGGRRNPDYDTLQSRLRRDSWSRFRLQLAPPPPPTVQIFGAPRDILGRPSPVQIFPGWNPSSPQTTTIFGGRF